jgi:uncharacterized cupredoxin-like copper-binding protein
MCRFRTVIAVATVGIFSLAACGNDADETTTTTSSTTTTEAELDDAALVYCERTAELPEDGLPTEEQLQGLVEVAPAEIKEDLELAAQGLTQRGFDAVADPDVAQAIGNIESWEEENCPGAGGGDEEEQEEEEEAAPPQIPDPDATQVAVTATDFEFQIDGDVPAEKVAFVMTNEGESAHHMSILKLKEGTTAEQAERSFQDASIPELIEGVVGQSSDAAPGEEGVVNAELAPGMYLMACFVDEPDGVPHAFKGMRTVFEVS